MVNMSLPFLRNSKGWTQPNIVENLSLKNLEIGFNEKLVLNPLIDNCILIEYFFRVKLEDFKIIDLVRSIKNVKIKHEEISEFIFNLKVYLPGQKNFRLISNKTRAEFVNSSINFEFIQRFPKSSITKVIDFSIQHFKVKGDSIFFVKIKNLIIDKCVLKLFEFTCVDKHQIAITSIRLPYKRACEY